MANLSGQVKTPQQFSTETIADDDYILFGQGSISKTSFLNLRRSVIKTGSLTGNMDSFTDTGCYWVDFENITNGPYNTGYGWIRVSEFSSTSRVQEVFKYNQNGISEVAFRGYTNSRWYPWRKIATEAI